MKRTLALAALAAALALSLLGAGTSTASAAAWNEGRVYLRYPIPSNFGTACVSRKILLKAGSYDWKVYMVHPAHPWDPEEDLRWLGLRGGWYRWWDCLGVKDSTHQYEHCSSLDELATSGRPARHWHYSSATPGGYGNGTYEYGSGLTWTGT